MFKSLVLVQERKNRDAPGRVKFLVVTLKLNVLYSQKCKGERSHSLVQQTHIEQCIIQGSIMFQAFIIPTRP